MTITEDLCKTLGVNINVPFILTCNSKVIYKVTEKDVFAFRCNSSGWQQMLYKDVLHYDCVHQWGTNASSTQLSRH